MFATKPKSRPRKCPNTTGRCTQDASQILVGHNHTAPNFNKCLCSTRISRWSACATLVSSATSAAACVAASDDKRRKYRAGHAGDCSLCPFYEDWGATEMGPAKSGLVGASALRTVERLDVQNMSLSRTLPSRPLLPFGSCPFDGSWRLMHLTGSCARLLNRKTIDRRAVGGERAGSAEN